MAKKEKEVEKEVMEETSSLTETEQLIQKLEKDVILWKEKTYRTIADCDNLRKSYEKDHEIMVKYRGQPFVEKLLPTLDSFYLVLKVVPEDNMLKNYLVGFQMIYNGMISALQDEGVEQIIPTVGCEFDPNIMQAIDVVEGDKDNIVHEISKPGYKIRDRLIRPAMVIVSKTNVEEDKLN